MGNHANDLSGSDGFCTNCSYLQSAYQAFAGKAHIFHIKAFSTCSLYLINLSWHIKIKILRCACITTLVVVGAEKLVWRTDNMHKYYRLTCMHAKLKYFLWNNNNNVCTFDIADNSKPLALLSQVPMSTKWREIYLAWPLKSCQKGAPLKASLSHISPIIGPVLITIQQSMTQRIQLVMGQMLQLRSISWVRSLDTLHLRNCDDFVGEQIQNAVANCQHYLRASCS